MNMFATQGGVVELWVTKTDTYTSTKTGEIYASVQSIAPIPEGARGNAKGFEISEYNIEPTLLDAIVFEGQPVLCKFASVVRPTQDRFGRITNTRKVPVATPRASRSANTTSSRPCWTPSFSKASRCSASSPAWSARPKTVSVGSPIRKSLWICWLWAASRWRRPPKPRPARKHRPKPRARPSSRRARTNKTSPRTPRRKP